jgi:peptidase E
MTNENNLPLIGIKHTKTWIKDHDYKGKKITFISFANKAKKKHQYLTSSSVI